MSFDPKLYLADIDGVDDQSLLSAWNWLFDGLTFTVFRATSMGDLILQDETGMFYFLDMVDGRIQKVAEAEEELWELLCDRNARKSLLFTYFVRELKQAGKSLSAGQCFSPDQPLILGGELDEDNFQPCDIQVHASIQGQIHQQLRNLPPGTKVTDVTIE